MPEALIEAPRQTLLEISDTISQMLQIMEECQDDPAAFQTIDAEIRRMVEVDLSAKVDSIGWLDKKIDLEVAGLQDLIKDIEAKIGTLHRRKKRMRDFVHYAMARLGTTKIKGQVTTISIRPGVESVDVKSEDEIPVSYFTEKTVLQLDKNKLKADLQAGVAVTGAALKTGSDILTIRS